MTYLVTGNRGFIGGHLMDALKNRSDTAIGFDKLTEYPTEEVLADFIRKNRVDGIYHLGARPFIPDCYGNSINAVVESNISFTARLLTAAKEANVKKFLYLSTSEVYGNSERIPINEYTPTNPLSTYAVSKYAAEALCRSFGTETGLDVRAMRQFNVYGPGDTHPRIIPILMMAAKHNKHITIGPIDVTRDFSYVKDVILALTKMMGIKKSELPEDKILVHGSGVETRLSDLITIIECTYGRNIKYDKSSSKNRPAEVYRLCADRTEFDILFGSYPHVSIEEGILRTKEWYDKNDWKWEVKNE